MLLLPPRLLLERRSVALDELPVNACGDRSEAVHGAVLRASRAAFAAVKPVRKSVASGPKPIASNEQ